MTRLERLVKEVPALAAEERMTNELVESAKARLVARSEQAYRELYEKARQLQVLYPTSFVQDAAAEILFGAYQREAEALAVAGEVEDE